MQQLLHHAKLQMCCALNLQHHAEGCDLLLWGQWTFLSLVKAAECTEDAGGHTSDQSDLHGECICWTLFQIGGSPHHYQLMPLELQGKWDSCVHSCVLGLPDDYAYGNSMRMPRLLQLLLEVTNTSTLAVLLQYSLPRSLFCTVLYEDTCLGRASRHSIH